MSYIELHVTCVGSLAVQWIEWFKINNKSYFEREKEKYDTV